MTDVLAPRPDVRQALYPPTVEPPPRPLPLRRFLLTFVRNPLSSLPRPVYEEPIVVHDNGRSVVAWVTDPALVEKVLLQPSAAVPQDAAREARLPSHAGRRHPHLRGRELALAAPHGGTAVPPGRSRRPGADHDGGGRGSGGALAQAPGRAPSAPSTAT